MKKRPWKLKGKVTLYSASLGIKLDLVCFLKDVQERLGVKIRHLNAAMENGGADCGATAGTTSPLLDTAMGWCGALALANRQMPTQPLTHWLSTMGEKTGRESS